MNHKESIIKSIVNYPNSLNGILLRIFVWPEIFYGRKYRHNKQILNDIDVAKKLMDIVNTSIEQVPYYHERYKYPVRDLDDFRSRNIFIDKQVVSEMPEKFINRTIDLNSYVDGTTGGTSGKPLRFLIPGDRYAFELAFIHNMWHRAGWNYHTRGVLRNHHLPENRIYEINPITREIIFDNFRLNHAYVNDIHKVLIKQKVKFIHAYPSAAYQFCKLCKDQGLDLSFIKAFLCGSEAVLDFQVKLISEELGIKLYNWYGHSEKLVLGGYCEHTDHFHIEPGYGYFELVDKNGNSITEPGITGEIVGTTLNNFGMPLIRYRTGDFAEYVGNFCRFCGRKMTIIKNVQGRWGNNFIYRRDGTYITTTALNLHSDLYNFIDGIQYEQNEPGELKILIVKKGNFTPMHEKQFINHFQKSFGTGNKVIIEYVDTLKMRPNGKFSLLISNLKLNTNI